MEAKSPACPQCQAPLDVAALNTAAAVPCAACGSLVFFEVFPAWSRSRSGSAATPAAAVEAASASCFYHAEKQAIVICGSCGRFLCELCDCLIHQRHLCPACLETRQKKGGIEDLEQTRKLYGRQAMVLAILPFFVTGMMALYIGFRYRKAPESIVSPRPWLFPVAIVLACLQLLAFAGLFVAIAMHS